MQDSDRERISVSEFLPQGISLVSAAHAKTAIAMHYLSYSSRFVSVQI